MNKYCDILENCKLVKMLKGKIDDLEKTADGLRMEIEELKMELEEKDRWTGLYDRRGKRIYFGNIVHWTDGGDELTLEERIKTRWDRIATVKKNGIETEFHTFDSPSQSVRINQPIFRYGCFIYTDTEKYLTVVAKNESEYKERFKNAGECMAYVLEANR